MQAAIGALQGCKPQAVGLHQAQAAFHTAQQAAGQASDQATAATLLPAASTEDVATTGDLAPGEGALQAWRGLG